MGSVLSLREENKELKRELAEEISKKNELLLKHFDICRVENLAKETLTPNEKNILYEIWTEAHERTSKLEQFWLLCMENC